MTKELMHLIISVAVFLIQLDKNGVMFVRAQSDESPNDTDVTAGPINYDCSKERFTIDWPCGGDGYIYLSPYKVCVKFYFDRLENFTNAEKICNEEGAALVRISSRNMEEDMISKLLPDDKRYDQMWIGLSKLWHRNFSWTMYPYYEPAYYTSWIGGKTPINVEKCVESNSTFVWKAVPCSWNRCFICERFSETFLFDENKESRLKPRVRSWIHGRTNYVSCSAIVDDGGYVSFIYKSETGWTELTPGKNRYIKNETLYEDYAYKRYPNKGRQLAQNRCTRRYRATLKFPFIASMHGERVQCYVRRSNGAKYNRKYSESFKITFDRKKPLLEVTRYPPSDSVFFRKRLELRNGYNDDKRKEEKVAYVSKNIVFTCGAFVGNTIKWNWSGYMRWSYKQTHQRKGVQSTSIKIDAHKRVSKGVLPKGVSFKYWNDVDMLKGPWIQSFIAVSVTPDIKKFQANCSTLSDHDSNYTVYSQTCVVFYHSLAPDLKISVHGEPAPTSSGVVNLRVSQLFVATCSGYVGTEGGLTWRVHTTFPSQQILEWTYDQIGETDRDKTATNFVSSTNISISHDDQKGPVMLVGLTILTSRIFHGANITCSTSNSEGFRAVSAGLKEWNNSPTFTLSVAYAPLRPKIKAGFQTGGKGRFLNINCTSFIGKSGTFTFAMITRKNNLIWRVNDRGEVFDSPVGDKGQMTRIDVTLDVFNLMYGPRISTTFATKEKGTSLDGVVFACYSHNVPDIFNFTTPEEEERKDELLSTTIVEYAGAANSSSTPLVNATPSTKLKWIVGLFLILLLLLAAMEIKNRDFMQRAVIGEDEEGSKGRSKRRRTPPRAYYGRMLKMVYPARPKDDDAATDVIEAERPSQSESEHAVEEPKLGWFKRQLIKLQKLRSKRKEGEEEKKKTEEEKEKEVDMGE